jgi:UDP-N-acetylglucosamine acyltransferase
VTIHRSASAEGLTKVGSECFLMAYAHIAHDCRVGDGVVMANNVILAGHVSIEDGAFLSGGVGVHQFSRVGRLAMIGGKSKLVQDALPFVTTDGNPGRAVGLNLVGLRRAGVKGAQLHALKEAYRLLLRAALPLEDALREMSALSEPLVEELIAFVRGSQRGFAHAAREQGVRA